jgi:phenylalanyl-tRNA synthetase beta chain
VRPERVSRLLGARVPAKEIETLLSGIGFSVVARPDDLMVTPPSWRHDVSRDVDLIEEVARLRGYDTLSDVLAPFRPSAAPDHALQPVMRRVRDALVAAGFSEVRPLPFVREGGTPHVRVTNPLADDEPFLRTSLLETLRPRAEYNLARREGNLRLFEVGSVFLPAGTSVHEECRAGVLLMGARRPVHFTEPAPPMFDAWDAKGLAHQLADAARPGCNVTLDAAPDGELWTIHIDGAQCGSVRALALDAPPWAAPAFGIELTLGELPLEAIAPPGANAHLGTDAPRVLPAAVPYRPLATMPAAEFDLAFVVPDNLPAARIETMLRQTAGDLLEQLVLFDEYRGEGVPPGHRSLAWRLTFRHPERTLNDKEIAARRQKLIAAVKKEHNVDARSS